MSLARLVTKDTSGYRKEAIKDFMCTDPQLKLVLLLLLESPTALNQHAMIAS